MALAMALAMAMALAVAMAMANCYNLFKENIMKKITETTLKKWNACEEGFDRFDELFPKGADLQTVSRRLIEDGHPSWDDWLWIKCKADNDYVDQTSVTAGYRGTATAGYSGTATAGDSGTATAGDRGAATAGYRGTATAGYGGTATTGYGGTATAGDRGTATAGYDGTATAGYGGVIVIEYHNGEDYVKKCAEVDGGKIKANTPYQIDDGEFREVV